MFLELWVFVLRLGNQTSGGGEGEYLPQVVQRYGTKWIFSCWCNCGRLWKHLWHCRQLWGFSFVCVLQWIWQKNSWTTNTVFDPQNVLKITVHKQKCFKCENISPHWTYFQGITICIVFTTRTTTILWYSTVLHRFVIVSIVFRLESLP